MRTRAEAGRHLTGISNQPICFVTGAARGIGKALADVVLESGGHVVAADVDAASLRASFPAEVRRCTTLALDVASAASVEHGVAELHLSRVDILFNSAGVYLDVDVGLPELGDAELMRTININALGPVRVTRALLGHLQQSKCPRVVNISSVMGSVGSNRSGASYAYRMSKAALNMFTKNLSIEFPAIVAVSVHPGHVRTRMGGPGAPLSPLQSARAIWKLACSLSAEQSGQFLDQQGRPLDW